MTEWLANLHTGIRLLDLVDVIIVAFIVYRVLLLIKGTRAMQMLTGLGILGIAFFAAQRFALFTSYWMLSYFFDYLILIVIVLFQDDLRRALTNVGKNPFFPGTNEEEQEMISEIARAASRLAREKIGALIVIERETGLKNFIETGSNLDCRVKAELLYSVFVPNSPIHDGAVIVTGGRIAAAGCFLPLSMDPNIDKKFGTRHRAALGLTEETDAVVVLVSEEAGECHLAKNGKFTLNLTETELRQSLKALLDVSKNQGSIARRWRAWIQSHRVQTVGGEHGEGDDA